MGLWPSVAPTGYISNPDRTKKCEVILDPQRHHVIKIMFEKIAYEGWSGRVLYKWLKDDLKFCSRTGRHLYLSNVYTILNNSFYCGLIEYPKKSGKWYNGRHEPIISQELYKKVQEKIHAKTAGVRINREFAFTKLMKCGLCNSGITADEKYKDLVDGSTAKYVYYGCTHYFDKNCKNTYLREESLIEQLSEIIDRIDINTLTIKEQFEREMGRLGNFRDKVLGLQEKGEAEKKADLRAYAKYLLKEGTLEEKRELMQSFKSRLILINKKVVLE